MTLSQLEQFCYAYLTGLKQKVADNVIVDLTINNAVVDIATRSCCLKTNKKFNVVAEQSEYALSEVLGDFLTPDKSGLWWSDGTRYKKLNSCTLQYLDTEKPSWRDFSSGSPIDYSIDNDVLTISPPPDTALTDGFLFYYGKVPLPMTSGAHYPFSGNTTPFTHLEIFDLAIIYYVESVLLPVISKTTDANLSMIKYMQEVESKIKLLKRRKDIGSGGEIRFRG
jgi:hypothetical protein